MKGKMFRAPDGEVFIVNAVRSMATSLSLFGKHKKLVAFTTSLNTGDGCAFDLSDIDRMECVKVSGYETETP